MVVRYLWSSQQAVEKYRLCHTVVVNGCEDVHRLLKTRAKAKGLAVPGMPIGSPGMEQGPRRQAHGEVAQLLGGLNLVDLDDARFWKQCTRHFHFLSGKLLGRLLIA